MYYYRVLIVCADGAYRVLCLAVRVFECFEGVVDGELLWAVSSRAKLGREEGLARN